MDDGIRSEQPVCQERNDQVGQKGADQVVLDGQSRWCLAQHERRYEEEPAITQKVGPFDFDY